MLAALLGGLYHADAPDMLSGARARDITLDRLTAYVVERQDAGRQLGTIRNELAVLKRAFHLAERAGKAICPPFPALTRPEREGGLLRRGRV